MPRERNCCDGQCQDGQGCPAILAAKAPGAPVGLLTGAWHWLREYAAGWAAWWRGEGW